MPRPLQFSRPASAGPVREGAAANGGVPAEADAAEAGLPAWPGHAKGSAAYRKILAGLAFAGVATFAQL